MKNIVRAIAVAVAVAGATAGVASSHAALGHQVILSAMPAPACSPASCNIRGGN
jgi:hypothetical protein